tara:strand:- start:1711 stop:2724 length:1014 start_codon:yes stop_codon:yes gene_type:complete
MNKTTRLMLTAIFTLLLVQPSLGATRAEQISQRIHNANAYRGHVMVVAHRGLSWQNGEIIYAENSLDNLEKSIAAGIDIVETDVRLTKDRKLVVLHDGTLNRTTTCKGKVTDITLTELKKCKLVIAEKTITNQTVPTLQEFFRAAKDRILINIDSKISLKDTEMVIQLARDEGVDGQIIIGAATNSEDDLANSLPFFERFKNSKVILMGNLHDDAVSAKFLYDILAIKNGPEIMQLRNSFVTGVDDMTLDGGPLFSRSSINMAHKYNRHYWINTLYTNSAGKRSGGRGDEMAVFAKMPNEVYGFWAKKGATLIQTDEPELAIEWLSKHNYRIPYKAE